MFPLRTRLRSPPPTETTVSIDGREIRIAVRQAPRASRYSLRLPPGGGDPVLTLPVNGRFAEALDFVQRHRPWLAERLARRPDKVPFADGALIPIRGIDTRIVHRADKLRGTTHLVDAPDGPELFVFGAADHLPRRVTDFLRKEARLDLDLAVKLHTGRLGVTAARVTLKDTKSRWGSCTAKGELAFSWRIIMAPAHVLDYLAAHEVAHIRELNHSHRFWRLVRETCPDMDRGQAWLKKNGSRLHLYGQ